MQLITKTSVDPHPKISGYLVYSGIIANIIILVFFFWGTFNLSFLAFFIVNSANVLLGFKHHLIDKYVSAKMHDRLVGALLLIGTIILSYDLIFNVFPNFK